MTPEDAQLRAEPNFSENVGFSPNFCSQAGGAVRGAKAEEEFDEARAALIRLERPSQRRKANPKFTGRSRGPQLGHCPPGRRDPFLGQPSPRSPSTCSSLVGKRGFSRPLLTGGCPVVALLWLGTSVVGRILVTSARSCFPYLAPTKSRTGAAGAEQRW